MSFENQTTIYGSNVNAIFRDGYEKGKKEQLEQDLAMIHDVLLKSEDFDDFRETLAREIQRIDTRVWA